MERMTEWIGEGPNRKAIARQDRRDIGDKDCVARLAAYEDTELEPEEVKEHEAAYIEIMTRTYGPFHQKIGQWLQAEKDGRLVVLPCKVGTPMTQQNFGRRRQTVKVHEVKTLPAFFWPQVMGLKPFEVRYNDRDYHVGDVLRQKEWSVDGGFTGAALDREITYVLDDPTYCKEGFVVLGLMEVDENG